MALPAAIQTRISALETRLSKCKLKLGRLRKDKKFQEYEKVRDEEFIGFFKDTCALVREAELANAPYLVELAKAADKILDDGVGYSYGRDSRFPTGRVSLADYDEGPYDFMPSWAHGDDGDRPLIKDENGGKFYMSAYDLESFMRIFQPGAGEDLSRLKNEPWNAALKRHPKSTDLSRFRSNLPTLTPTPNKPLAASVLDARCEISSLRCATPIRFHTSPGNTCLVLTAMGGHRNRTSVLEYLMLGQPLAPSEKFPVRRWIEPKFFGVGYHATIDETRRLIFLGDDRRIKSYEWGSPTEVYSDPLPVHNLNTEQCTGPMTIVDNRSVLRAGKGGASVWDIQSTLDEGSTVEEPIDLDELDENGDWEGEVPEAVDRSPGLAPTSHIKFLDQPNLKPSLWQPLLTAPSTVVCVEYAREAGKYSCIGIDLEAGKSTSCYLGHGADVSALSVSVGNPQLFLTACNDGFVRLFDVRRPLPSVTFDACGQREFCEAAALAHPDGIPIVFTGTHRGEQIKMWDVRARACVYELSTGNNAVQSLAWDDRSNCLYAATEWEHMDNYGYRYAKIPKWQNIRPYGEAMEEEEEEEEEEEGEEEEGDWDLCWPIKAWHKEDYFGRLFDAAEHRIIRYAFKENPKLSVIPEYGGATVGDGDDW
ncbi:DENN domain and WD repeat-containing protein SCD1 [Rhizoctonia solani]|uniref:DENN domain and WD repeat-containing protein SCD1 n=1 Tax=Rhizoctonia solani TaxID=456999 RepID=A0A0K6G7X4_9AGAM|nr:DENN domain and WD repeat-containing protein SCD1 [Rhizoctonia solani]